MRLIAVLITLTLAACLQSGTFLCDQQICGVGAVCTPGGCASEAAALACAGQADGAPCAIHGTARGTCNGQACRTSECGDGVVALGEACDDGNTIDGDGCAANCASTEVCGNGILDPGEACDDGNVANGDTCHANCTVPRCGDRIVDTLFGEVCDDGNTIDGDGCAAACASSELCGNGLIDTHVGEACDDGNLSDGDACQHTCQLPRCGDGITDTRFAEACDDGNLLNGDGCAANCRSDETCGNGFIDVGLGEQCDNGDANSDAPDHACRMNCKVRRCGDGIPDSAERCDDGNNIDADGCAADCHSNEQCGNQLTDYAAGETCDTGVPGLSGDGCSSQCDIEFATWHDRTWTEAGCFSDTPCIIYSAKADALLSFDGFRMWQLSDAGWHRIMALGDGPTYLSEFALAAAPDGTVYVLGGTLENEVLATQAWAFDGAQWQNLPLGDAGPVPRGHAQAAYDSHRNRLVLFGGEDANGDFLDETWEYVAGAWQARATRWSPPTQSRGCMAFDEAHQRSVLLVNNADGDGMEAWAYNGEWLALGAAPLGPRENPFCYYDIVAQRLVVGGGKLDGEQLRDVWELGATWAAKPMLPDAPLEHTVSAGRTARYEIATDYRTTYFYRQDAWQTNQAPDHYDAAIGYSAEAGGIVLFGGETWVESVHNLPTTTWLYANGLWRALAIASPPPRVETAMAYDAQRHRLVLFGGADAQQVFADTWEFDGATWHHMFPSAAPPARRGHKLAFDSTRKRIVLHGGVTAIMADYEAKPRTDTWAYTGSTWTLLKADGPPARTDFDMAYDPNLDRIVLFGGYRNYDGDDATWAFDGTTWRQVPTPVAPSPRFGAALAYDANLNALVLLGGVADTGLRATDTWRLDGAQWTRIPTTQAPEAYDYVMTFDLGNRTLVAVAPWALTSTWAFASASLSQPTETCTDATTDADLDSLAGCADPDCWYRCTPECQPNRLPLTPAATAWPLGCTATLPHCGDGACNLRLEDHALCPSDCSP